MENTYKAVDELIQAISEWQFKRNKPATVQLQWQLVEDEMGGTWHGFIPLGIGAHSFGYLREKMVTVGDETAAHSEKEIELVVGNTFWSSLPNATIEEAKRGMQKLFDLKFSEMVHYSYVERNADLLSKGEKK